MIELLESKRQAFEEVCSRFGVARLEVFGSALREESCDAIQSAPGVSIFRVTGRIVSFGPQSSGSSLSCFQLLRPSGRERRACAQTWSRTLLWEQPLPRTSPVPSRREKRNQFSDCRNRRAPEDAPSWVRADFLQTRRPTVPKPSRQRPSARAIPGSPSTRSGRSLFRPSRPGTW